jgi:hypothetical protein
MLEVEGENVKISLLEQWKDKKIELSGSTWDK